MKDFLCEKQRKKFTYIYDFGDDWFHDIIVKAKTEDTLLYPRCIAEKGACPPENYGGIWSDENMKATLFETSQSKDAKMFRKWLELGKGLTFDSKAFDIEKINKQIMKIIDSTLTTVYCPRLWSVRKVLFR